MAIYVSEWSPRAQRSLHSELLGSFGFPSARALSAIVCPVVTSQESNGLVSVLVPETVEREEVVKIA
jgi:hypothetical protein